VRLYEQQGLIGKAKRAKNGYRIFYEYHYLQLFICRKIFMFPYSNARIRKSGVELIYASATLDYSILMEKLYTYQKVIEEELIKAENGKQILDAWVEDTTDDNNDAVYTRAEIADILNTTVETVRNWERNDLAKASTIGVKHRKLFNEQTKKRFEVIYVLRQVGFSMVAIHNCFAALDAHEESPTLNVSKQEAFSAGDRWLFELQRLRKTIPELNKAVSKLQTLHLPTTL